MRFLMERVAVLRCGVVEYNVIFELMKDLQKKRIAGEILSLIHI